MSGGSDDGRQRGMFSGKVTGGVASVIVSDGGGVCDISSALKSGPVRFFGFDSLGPRP
jgi:hypothetical protein